MTTEEGREGAGEGEVLVDVVAGGASRGAGEAGVVKVGETDPDGAPGAASACRVVSDFDLGAVFFFDLDPILA